MNVRCLELFGVVVNFAGCVEIEKERLEGRNEECDADGLVASERSARPSQYETFHHTLRQKWTVRVHVPFGAYGRYPPNFLLIHKHSAISLFVIPEAQPSELGSVCHRFG